MKSFLIYTIFIIPFIIGCDNKTVINESIVAKTKNISRNIDKPFEKKSYKLKTLENKTIEFTNTKSGLDFKDYKSKKAVLLNVFATWCPPCIEEIPMLKDIKDRYKDSFEIVAVLFEEGKKKEEIKDFVKKYGINYPITMGEENFVLAKDLGDIQKVPEMYLFSKEGRFVQKFVGLTTKEKLENAVKVAIDN